MNRTRFPSWDVARGLRPLSRRRFLQAAAVTLGALGASLAWPSAALAVGRDAKPIPGGRS